MSHYAKIENGIVIQVIVAEEDVLKQFPGHWVQTSYNTSANTHLHGKEPLRGNFAGVGFTYDDKHDVFYSPQPYPSWILNTSTWTWESPVAHPTDDKSYSWNETTKSWDELTQE